MAIIETDKGVIVMADYLDYELKKAQMAWELALRIIPKEVAQSGRWTEHTFIASAQEVLKKAYETIDTVFVTNK